MTANIKPMYLYNMYSKTYMVAFYPRWLWEDCGEPDTREYIAGESHFMFKLRLSKLDLAGVNTVNIV